jgi:hypothetical protein
MCTRCYDGADALADAKRASWLQNDESLTGVGIKVTHS